METHIRRFERGVLDSPGEWGRPSSSIDWCERNYVVNWYLAEFVNTITCFSMVTIGLVAVVVAKRLELPEGRWQAHGWVWALVGMGSAFFHGTLSHHGQMLDELPMMWAVFVWCYCLLRVYDERKYTFRAVFIIYTMAYSALQVYFTFVLAFQLQYTVLVLFGVFLTDRNARADTTYSVFSCASVTKLPHGHQQLLHMMRQHIFVLLLGFVFWLLDQFACESLHNLPSGMPNPQFHAWWHVLIAWSIHLGYQYSMALRVAELRGDIEQVSWTWLAGVWPIAADPTRSKSD